MVWAHCPGRDVTTVAHQGSSVFNGVTGIWVGAYHDARNKIHVTSTRWSHSKVFRTVNYPRSIADWLHGLTVATFNTFSGAVYLQQKQLRREPQGCDYGQSFVLTIAVDTFMLIPNKYLCCWKVWHPTNRVVNIQYHRHNPIDNYTVSMMGFVRDGEATFIYQRHTPTKHLIYLFNDWS